MSLSIIGFPRIGANRELKFATEKYFKQEISENELNQIAKDIRLENWQSQKNNQIDFPVSNDFSFYDQVLDTSFFLNAIPKRYQELQLSTLGTYFALARGFQDDTRDVKALPMKKWFNTNYHYLVPELDNPATIKADTTKIISEFLEAKTAGLETKPVIVGPYTFLKLADFTNNTNLNDYLEAVTAAYITLLKDLKNAGVTYLQIDEPALVLDQTQADITLFETLYKAILANKNGLEILLQTYFGDIRDSYQAVTALDFDGFGLDFIEGKETLNLIEQYGFPENKTLVAGVVNGKNIWRNDYQKTLNLLAKLPKNITLSIGTSCSLQHVPVTTTSENVLDETVLKHFAFAVEKLAELKELGEIYFNQNTAFLEENKQLFNGSRTTKNTELETKINSLTKADFTRLPDALERRETQKAILNLPILPTTTIGSFPQTQEIRRERLAFKRQEISKEAYENFLEERTTEVIEWQDKIGLDVLVHGEFERNDMVEYFGEQLDGYIFTQKAWVQSYGTRCVKPPIIWGDITRPHEMTVRWTAFAQSQTEKPVKGMLTGPVTILNWSFPREDITIKESTLQIALAIQEEVLDLEKAGIKIIQIDEAALREKLPLRQSDWFSEYLDWTIPAFRLVHAKVEAKTQIHTHMCYSEFEDIIEAIDNMDADVISFEASRSDLSILDSLKKHQFRTLVGPGVYDIHSPRIPSVVEIKNQITKIAEKVPTEQIWINPDCGLKTRGNKETTESLQNLVKATLEFRKEHHLYE